MSEAKHTQENGFIKRADGEVVAMFRTEDDANQFVAACNAHDELLESLDDVVSLLEKDEQIRRFEIKKWRAAIAKATTAPAAEEQTK